VPVNDRQMINNTFEHINSFFESYAKALEAFDSKAIAQHYSIPCTFLSNEAATAFTDFSALEGLFIKGMGFYKQFGIAHARPEVWSKRPWTDRIAKVKLEWKYYDTNNKPIYNCDYHYILRLDKNDSWKIEMAVSVNEKERMEEWLKKK
jgi:hypothetical protein